MLFKFGTYPTIVSAPIIMVSSNQINAVVPVPPPAALVYTLTAPNAWVQVQETTGTGASATVVTTSWYPVTFVPEVPGVFTFGGLGLGQAAVLNYDVTAGYSINSAKNPAPKGSTFSLYVTGMGDLTAGSTITVTDSSITAGTGLADFRADYQPHSGGHGDRRPHGRAHRRRAERLLGDLTAGYGRSAALHLERHLRPAHGYGAEFLRRVERHPNRHRDLFSAGRRHR